MGQRTRPSVKCAPRNMTILEAKREGATMDDLKKVHVYGSETRVNDAVKRRKPERGDCLLILVFSPYCPFSAKIAPFVNALPRAFPLLEIGAVDAVAHRAVAHRFGVVGVPSIVLFQKNKLVATLNDSEGLKPDLEALLTSVEAATGLTPDRSVGLEESDFAGPLKSAVVEETDVYLVLSWAFLIFFAVQKFLRSSFGRSVVTSVLLHWRAAQEVAEEEEHPHED